MRSTVHRVVVVEYRIPEEEAKRTLHLGIRGGGGASVAQVGTYLTSFAMKSYGNVSSPQQKNGNLYILSPAYHI